MYPTATGGMHNGQACYGHLQHAPSFNQASATNIAQVSAEVDCADLVAQTCSGSLLRWLLFCLKRMNLLEGPGDCV